MTLSQSTIDAIKSRDDLASFIEELVRDLSAAPSSWENRDLPRFLGALAAWTRDMDGYYVNQGKSVPATPEWNTFANMLVAAKMYE